MDKFNKVLSGEIEISSQELVDLLTGKILNLKLKLQGLKVELQLYKYKIEVLKTGLTSDFLNNFIKNKNGKSFEKPNETDKMINLLDDKNIKIYREIDSTNRLISKFEETISIIKDDLFIKSKNCDSV